MNNAVKRRPCRFQSDRIAYWERGPGGGKKVTRRILRSYGKGKFIRMARELWVAESKVTSTENAEN